MKAEDLKEFLKQRQVEANEDRIQNATRFRGPDGEIFCVYDTGKFVPQGNLKSALAAAVAKWAGEETAVPGGAGGVADHAAPSVFIAYGHDISARNDLELLLRRMGLEPIILANLPATGDTLIEKLEAIRG